MYACIGSGKNGVGLALALECMCAARKHPRSTRRSHRPADSEEEEEEDLFVFNDTIEGPRAPAVKPGRITQA